MMLHYCHCLSHYILLCPNNYECHFSVSASPQSLWLLTCGGSQLTYAVRRQRTRSVLQLALSYAKRIRAYAFETLGRADHVLVPPAH